MNYRRLALAQEFYSNSGYIETTVPWKIPAKYCKLVSGHNKTMIGSAEQSLVYLYLTRQIGDGYFFAVSPCFRYEDKLDKYHQHEFMKLEIICLGYFRQDDLIEDALAFFKTQTNQNLEVIKTEIGFDINLNGIEIGSYGCKSVKGLEYTYGTGIALPRFDLALDIHKGYHQEYIQKGVIGEVSKISEEYLEFIDSVKQDNQIMSLVELSDLIGAIDAYISKFNLSINDLKTMSDVTKKVFLEGVRK
jgi:hypothetical protein